ncbi:MAG: NAD(+)/NADH kinase [Myxococcales bacterium]|nr:NAD(+)/NADH kinase [Myxococcales bacterium]
MPNEGVASHISQLVEEEDDSVTDLLASHDEHQHSLELAREVLTRRGIQFIEQHELPAPPVESMDLVIAIGGDGIVLGASHAVLNSTPILGVNSAPTFSVGHLSGCTAETLDTTLRGFELGEIQPIGVQRLQLKVGGHPVHEPVLNDILFCADNPAIMSRYVIHLPEGQEHQRSSGIWISTAAGSTAALASAGGPILPLTAKQYAFVVREPYCPPGKAIRYRNAILDQEQSLKLECRTINASIFIDGTHHCYPVAFGESVEISIHPQPLYLLQNEP